MFDPLAPAPIQPKDWPERLRQARTLGKRAEVLSGVHYGRCDDATWSDLCEAVISASKDDAELLSKAAEVSAAGKLKAGSISGVDDAMACHLSGIPKSAPALAWLAPISPWPTHTIRTRAALRFLLWSGFDPNAQDDDGNTALHLAVKNGSKMWNEQAIEMLLDADAKVDIPNKLNQTPGLLLAQHDEFTAQTIRAWVRLENAGEDFTLRGGDGLGVLEHLVAAQDKKPHENRGELIEYVRWKLDGGVEEDDGD